MSYTYTDYVHRQFNRPFLSPLPMPSPTSCWYLQSQNVQFGYSCPDPTHPISAPPISVPRPSSVSYPRPEPDPPDGPLLYTASQQPYQLFQPPSPPYQPPYNGVDDMEPFDMPRDPVTQDLESNLSMAALASQLERLTAIVRELTSQMDSRERFLGDPHAATSNCGTAAPVPVAAADTSLNLPQPAPPCSPDIIGDERELLDDSSPPSAAISLHVTKPFLASNRHPQVDVPSSRKKEWENNQLHGLSFVSEVLLKELKI